MVLNWNGAQHLAECLPSVVTAAEAAGTEVWVVDNASTDASEELCRTRFPSVRFEQIGENVSLAAYNVAAERATTDVIVSLDNDVIVEPDFLAPMLAHFVGCDDLFAVSGATQDGLDATGVEWKRGMLRRGQPLVQTGPVFYNCGCVTARDRRKLLEIGGFDRLFFPLYFEDTDLSWRAWKRGWRCVYEPSSVVHHKSGGALGRSPSVEALIARNEWLFHWKNVTDREYVVAHLAAAAPRLALEVLRRDTPRLRGFTSALRLLPAALRARRRARAQAVRGDAQAAAAVNGS